MFMLVQQEKPRFTPYGANLTLWQPPNHHPVIWVSQHALYQEGTAIRGGVPICFPWFAKGLSGHMLPSHGLARLSTWQRISVTEDDDAITAVYTLDSTDAFDAARFAHPYHVAYTMRLGSHLELSYAVTNTGSESFMFEEALHTYLTVSDVHDIVVEGLDGHAYRDNTNGETCTQEGDVRFTGEVDRVYDSADEIRVVDPGWQRTARHYRTNSESRDRVESLGRTRQRTF